MTDSAHLLGMQKVFLVTQSKRDNFFAASFCLGRDCFSDKNVVQNCGRLLFRNPLSEIGSGELWTASRVLYMYVPTYPGTGVPFSDQNGRGFELFVVRLGQW